jgi:hypothetical protein
MEVHRVLDNRLIDGGNVVSLTHKPPFTPKNIPGTHVLNIFIIFECDGQNKDKKYKQMTCIAEKNWVHLGEPPHTFAN